ncbi:MAG: HAD-IA family hydrolase [Cellulomonas sp.]
MTTATSDPRPAPARDVLDEVFDAVLFDMDGTLISSTRSVERCWLRLADEFGMPTDDLSPFRYHGVPARDILDLLLADRDAAERASALARVVELEVSDTEGIEVLPGAVEALAALGAVGGAAGRAAVVTSCGSRLAAARIAAVALPAPATVVTADDVERGKPDPEPYRAGAARLGVDVRRCLVVEDAESGIRSGRAAGAAVLAVRTTEAEGPGGGADLVVDDLSKVRFEVTGAGVRVRRA